MREDRTGGRTHARRGDARRAFGAGVLAAMLSSLVGGAAAQSPAVDIRHCVGGPPLRMAEGDRRAVLDDAERTAVVAEMTERFPVLARDGFDPTVVMLWRKAEGETLYVSLRPWASNDATLCFTATFVAKLFRATPALTQKYFS